MRITLANVKYQVAIVLQYLKCVIIDGIFDLGCTNFRQTFYLVVEQKIKIHLVGLSSWLYSYW